jgi:polyvinyl alcohol dehydrogenase (cytochrome)
MLKLSNHFTRTVFAWVLLGISINHSVQAQHENPVDGQTLFEKNCGACHLELTQDDSNIPSIGLLNRLSANAIVAALTDGAMRLQGESMSESERIAVAEYLSAGKFFTPTLSFTQGMCSDNPALLTPDLDNVWSGWGRDPGNSRFTQNTGGINASNVSQLKLKWAFGVPDVTVARSQPAIYGDRLFVGSQAGAIFSLNALTGCTYWSYQTEGGVRSAISVEKLKIEGEEKTVVLASDLRAKVYAIDAHTGELIWSRKVDQHSAAIGTASLKYHQGIIYVPLAGLPEEALANHRNDYECCSFRGSITALDASTGQEIWKTYTLPEPELVKVLPDGRELRGPAGASVWNTPSVDEKRGLLYFATGNAYAEPEAPTSNAILAVELATGKLVWYHQTLAADIWSGGCEPGLGGKKDNPGCYIPVGPDFDFSASPILTKLPSGKDIIIATQKSGQGWAFDPDNEGALLWMYRWGVGAAAGGVYGASVDEKNAYFAVADQRTKAPGGLHAVDLKTGERAWFTPAADLLCAPAPNCGPAQSAAVTSIPGVVFSGSMDGGLRAYNTQDGQIIWTFNANRSFDTVNGIPATGGSLDAAGPVIANGMLYVTSGNGGPFGSAGNVILAFSLE